MRQYQVDTVLGSVMVRMSDVGTHADVTYLDNPCLAPVVFHPYIPSPFIWSIKLVEVKP